MKIDWKKVSLLVSDFDGVMTDGFVLVDQDGKESVRCSRRDGLGVALLAERGIKTIVISKERNGVVAARCAKLGIECFSGIDDKIQLLKKLLEEKDVEPGRVCYVGDDVTDIDCIRYAGIGVAVADALPATRKAADYVTRANGGSHALREVCDLIRNAA